MRLPWLCCFKSLKLSTHKRHLFRNQTTLMLDISVISAVIYCISPSIILQIPFTVNNCYTLCIMGIFRDVRPHIERRTVYFKIVVYYCIYCNSLFGSILLRVVLFPNFLHLDWHDWLTTPCLQRRNSLGLNYTDVLQSLVIFGKSVVLHVTSSASAWSTSVHQKYTGHHFTLCIHCR